MANKRWILFGLVYWVVTTTIIVAQDEDTSENTSDHLDHGSPPQDKSPLVESSNTRFSTAWIVVIGWIGVCVVVLVVFILWHYWRNRSEKSEDGITFKEKGDMLEHVLVPIFDLLVKELKTVDYYELGIHLGLSPGDLKMIELNYQLVERRRSEVLVLWRKKEANPTWEKVIKALEKMEEFTLAAQLKQSYTRPAHKKVMAESNLQGTEIELHRSGKIAKELEKLGRQHFKLVVDAELELTKINPPIRRFSHTYMPGVNASSVEELFDKINELGSCLHYSLLENVVKLFLKNTTVADRFSKYCEHVEQFKKSTTVQQFMGSIEQVHSQTSTKKEGLKTGEKSQAQTGRAKEEVKMCTVMICLVGGWLPKTIKDLDTLIREIFQGKSSVLAHIKILPGSVIVTYLAPQSEITYLAELARNNRILMPKIGICRIQIGETEIMSSLNENSFSFESSLVEAAKNKDIHLLQFLLDLNTTVNAADKWKQTALFWASCNGHIASVDLLLKTNANPNCQRFDGATPLHAACGNGHLPVVNRLLTANANPKLEQYNGTTPLNLAHQNGHSAIVSLLIEVASYPGSWLCGWNPRAWVQGYLRSYVPMLLVHNMKMITIWLILFLLAIVFLFLCKYVNLQDIAQAFMMGFILTSVALIIVYVQTMVIIGFSVNLIQMTVSIVALAIAVKLAVVLIQPSTWFTIFCAILFVTVVIPVIAVTIAAIYYIRKKYSKHRHHRLIDGHEDIPQEVYIVEGKCERGENKGGERYEEKAADEKDRGDSVPLLLRRRGIPS